MNTYALLALIAFGAITMGPIACAVYNSRKLPYPGQQGLCGPPRARDTCREDPSQRVNLAKAHRSVLPVKARGTNSRLCTTEVQNPIYGFGAPPANAKSPNGVTVMTHRDAEVSLPFDWYGIRPNCPSRSTLRRRPMLSTPTPREPS